MKVLASQNAQEYIELRYKFFSTYTAKFGPKLLDSFELPVQKGVGLLLCFSFPNHCLNCRTQKDSLEHQLGGIMGSIMILTLSILLLFPTKKYIV
jgi:hypothetical protein